MSYFIERIPGINAGLQKDVVVLSCAGRERFINVTQVYEGTRVSIQNSLKRSMDYWMKGVNKNRCHHGWPRSEFGGKYTHCWVFKENGGPSRIYGFLTHPSSKLSRLWVCVLVHFAYKNQKHTDESVLAGVDRIRILSEVELVLRDYYK